MALKVYRAPDGGTWQFEEGKQPKSFEPLESKAEQPQVKPDELPNKQAKPKNKGGAR